MASAIYIIPLTVSTFKRNRTTWSPSLPPSHFWHVSSVISCQPLHSSLLWPLSAGAGNFASISEEKFSWRREDSTSLSHYKMTTGSTNSLHFPSMIEPIFSQPHRLHVGPTILQKKKKKYIKTDQHSKQVHEYYDTLELKQKSNSMHAHCPRTKALRQPSRVDGDEPLRPAIKVSYRIRCASQF